MNNLYLATLLSLFMVTPINAEIDPVQRLYENPDFTLSTIYRTESKPMTPGWASD